MPYSVESLPFIQLQPKVFNIHLLILLWLVCNLLHRMKLYGLEPTSYATTTSTKSVMTVTQSITLASLRSTSAVPAFSRSAECAFFSLSVNQTQQLALQAASLQRHHRTYCNQAALVTLGSGQPPQPPVYSILPELVTSHNISLHISFGEYDMLPNPYDAELILKNMTWNRAQGCPHQ